MIKKIAVSLFIVSVIIAGEAFDGLESLRKDMEAIMRASRKSDGNRDHYD